MCYGKMNVCVTVKRLLHGKTESFLLGRKGFSNSFSLQQIFIGMFFFWLVGNDWAKLRLNVI